MSEQSRTGASRGRGRPPMPTAARRAVSSTATVRLPLPLQVVDHVGRIHRGPAVDLRPGDTLAEQEVADLLDHPGRSRVPRTGAQRELEPGFDHLLERERRVDLDDV